MQPLWSATLGNGLLFRNKAQHGYTPVMRNLRVSKHTQLRYLWPRIYCSTMEPRKAPLRALVEALRPFVPRTIVRASDGRSTHELV